MSRSALVTIRWSNTKLPLSEPATSRSEGSHWRRSSSAKISSQRALALARGGTHAGIHSQSASKWQSSVSVSRRAGPPQLGQVVCTKSSRSASGLPVPVGLRSSGQQHRQLLLGHGHGAALLAVDDRDRRAPGALAGDREVVGAVAHRRATAGRRRSAAPLRRPSLGVVHLAAQPLARSARRCGRARGCRARRSRRSARRPRARSAPAGLAGRGGGQRTAGVDQRDLLGVARVALQAAGAQLLELLEHAGIGDPALDLGVLGRDRDEARLRRARRRGA